MAVNFYIDGFNLYYGSLKKYPRLKWLDISQMCCRLLPGREINKIRYFTARVSSLPHDPQASDRQDIYLRALRTIPNLTIHFGKFVTRKARMPRYPIRCLRGQHSPEMVDVVRTEEKRSDVNLATCLLVDCFEGDFEEAAIVSNDSDLTLAVKMVVEKYGKPVAMVNPHPRESISREMVDATTSQIMEINRRVLAKSQFPNVMSDAAGEFRRPTKWR